MLQRYEYQGLTWIDLESPTADELESITQEFELGPILMEELLTPTVKPRVDAYPECAYAVFHFPAIRHTREKTPVYEVDVILGKKYMITVHYEPMDAIDDFSRSFEAATLLSKKQGKIHVGHLLFELAERLYLESESELQSLEDTLQDIEEGIFAGEEKKMVVAISNAGREILAHKRIFANHEETIDTLEQVGVSLLGDSMRHYFKGVAALHYRVHNHVLMLSDTLGELRDTNMALLTTRQNEIMKNLTIVAFVTFPLTLIAGIFGMNTVNTPIVGVEGDFLIILSGMIFLTLVFFTYFKIKRWF